MLLVKEAFPSAILGSHVVADSSVHLGDDGGQGFDVAISRCSPIEFCQLLWFPLVSRYFNRNQSLGLPTGNAL